MLLVHFLSLCLSGFFLLIFYCFLLSFFLSLPIFVIDILLIDAHPPSIGHNLSCSFYPLTLSLRPYVYLSSWWLLCVRLYVCSSIYREKVVVESNCSTTTCGTVWMKVAGVAFPLPFKKEAYLLWGVRDHHHHHHCHCHHRSRAKAKEKKEDQKRSALIWTN